MYSLRQYSQLRATVVLQVAKARHYVVLHCVLRHHVLQSKTQI